MLPHEFPKNVGAVSQKYPDISEVKFLKNSTINSGGFVAYDKKQDEIIVVFRGTEPWSIKNWITDLDTLTTNYDACSGCLVHEGFYSSYLSLKAQLFTTLSKLLSEHPKAKKSVTGHSLGGAIAVHAALDIANQYGPIDSFFTFGQPRVGNRQFAQYFNEKMERSSPFRVTHQRDPVPHVPTEIQGFVHQDTEVFYNFDSSSYKICGKGEDGACSKGLIFNVNVNDHQTYLRTDLTLYMLACKF